jgi:glycosyltransferase involved in cell wall biosynthesis
MQEIESLGVNIIVNSSQGVAAALNTGLRQIDNTYIRRMDSDDIWINSVDTNEIKRLLDLNYWVCGRPINLHGKFEKRFSFVPELPKGVVSKYSFLPGNPICHPTMYFSKSSITIAGGYNENSVAEDFNMWLKLVLAGENIFYLPKNFVYYRRSNFQTSKQLVAKQISEEEFKLWYSLIGIEFDATKEFLEFAVCRRLRCTHTKSDLKLYKDNVFGVINKLLNIEKTQIDSQTILNIVARFYISIFKHISRIRIFYHLLEISVMHPIICINILMKSSVIVYRNLIFKYR